MLVEAGKESEYMLAGQAVSHQFRTVRGELVPTGALTVVAHRNATRLASGDITAFEDDHFETAFDQLVRGTHACDAAAQNDNPSRHKLPHPWRLVL